MDASLRSEFRKLLTVRSTYVMLALALLLVGVMAFWVEGYKGISGSPASVLGTGAIEEIVRNTALTASTFGTIVAILIMAHEYRYNLITYTLTLTGSRTKVLLSKIITMVAYTLVFTLICGICGVVFYYLGVSSRGAALPPQDIDWLYMAGRIVFYNVGQVLLALLITVLVRSVTAAIAIFFLFPATVEPLLGLLLNERAVYLPFAAFGQVVAAPGSETMVQGQLTVVQAIVVCSIYLVAGWLVTWQVFLRRDAN